MTTDETVEILTLNNYCWNIIRGHTSTERIDFIDERLPDPNVFYLISDLIEEAIYERHDPW